ncbi:MAG TPA: alpha-amylase family glycosyl hydrolase [Kofleriaceae bacterium]|nr:alpha-amylase family glycosyl hydrolase [Kofleriaceae bacterium]
MHLRDVFPLRSSDWAALLIGFVAAACQRAMPPAPAAPAPVSPDAPSEPARAPGSFADNPILYFVMTDRFVNGDPTNDASYGRSREPVARDDVGTFHGGDLRGLTRKVNDGWFDALGVNALWITAPYEQIHGWVVGGDKQFKHYAYHGYYALDYTLLDQNMGTPDDLRALVAAAHGRGIRILFDVVMNHPGYLDITTARQLHIPVLWPDADKATLTDYHTYIDYNNFKFGDWWGRAWVRAGLPGYKDGGQDELTKQLAYLPDFRTESTEAVTLPVFLRNKPDTRARDLPNTTVRGYLIAWLTDWVRTYGIDGFRCDTVKHVEPEAWAELKRAATAALAQWKAEHAHDQARGLIDDAAFWMVGEFWGHGPERGPLHDAGFDAMINFEFQDQVKATIGKPDTPERIEALFARYAALQHGKPAQMLNYASSHDTELFDRSHLIEAGTALLLAPGAAQVYYGDETARPPGFAPSGDPQQATRSDMNWDRVDEAVLRHWRALGSFRARHVAIAHGVHARLAASPYVFSRVDGPGANDDRVVVALDVPAGASIPVAPVFADGTALRDATTGARYVVRGGAVVITGAERAVLLERIAPR